MGKCRNCKLDIKDAETRRKLINGGHCTCVLFFDSLVQGPADGCIHFRPMLPADRTTISKVRNAAFALAESNDFLSANEKRIHVTNALLLTRRYLRLIKGERKLMRDEVFGSLSTAHVANVRNYVQVIRDMQATGKAIARY